MLMQRSMGRRWQQAQWELRQLRSRWRGVAAAYSSGLTKGLQRCFRQQQKWLQYHWHGSTLSVHLFTNSGGSAG